MRGKEICFLVKFHVYVLTSQIVDVNLRPYSIRNSNEQNRPTFFQFSGRNSLLSFIMQMENVIPSHAFHYIKA